MSIIVHHELDVVPMKYAIYVLSCDKDGGWNRSWSSNPGVDIWGGGTEVCFSGCWAPQEGKPQKCRWWPQAFTRERQKWEGRLCFFCLLFNQPRRFECFDGHKPCPLQEGDNSTVTQRGAAVEGNETKEEGQKEGAKDGMSALKKVRNLCFHLKQF